MWLKRIKYNIKKRSALSVVINSSGEVLLCCPLTLYVIMSLEFEYSLSQHAVSQRTHQWPNMCTRSTDSRARELIETHPPTVCFSVEINTIWIATKINGAPKLLCFPHSSEYLPCVLQNKDIHTGLELLDGEYMMTEFSFWGEISL